MWLRDISNGTFFFVFKEIKACWTSFNLFTVECKNLFCVNGPYNYCHGYVVVCVNNTFLCMASHRRKSITNPCVCYLYKGKRCFCILCLDSSSEFDHTHCHTSDQSSLCYHGNRAVTHGEPDAGLRMRPSLQFHLNIKYIFILKNAILRELTYGLVHPVTPTCRTLPTARVSLLGCRLNGG